MKARFQIAECSLSSAKIQSFAETAKFWRINFCCEGYFLSVGNERENMWLN